MVDRCIENISISVGMSVDEVVTILQNTKDNWDPLHVYPSVEDMLTQDYNKEDITKGLIDVKKLGPVATANILSHILEDGSEHALKLKFGGRTSFIVVDGMAKLLGNKPGFVQYNLNDFIKFDNLNWDDIGLADPSSSGTGSAMRGQFKREGSVVPSTLTDFVIKFPKTPGMEDGISEEV